jgi:hypothetical protein
LNRTDAALAEEIAGALQHIQFGSLCIDFEKIDMRDSVLGREVSLGRGSSDGWQSWT